MIPFVSSRCSRGGSLSQLSLDVLKLPGQVYSAVTPFAAGAGRVELNRPGSYLQAQTRTLWHRDPTSPLRCLYIYTHLFNNIFLDSELQTPDPHSCCLSLYSSCIFVLCKCLITAWFGSYMLQAETDRMQRGHVSHFRRLLLPHSEKTTVSSHAVVPLLQRTRCKER